MAERSLDQAQVVEVAGELDVSNAERFVEVVFAAASRSDARVIIDLEDTDFIDSTVLNVLFASATKLRTGGGKLVIVCTKDHLYRVLEASGIDGLFPVVPSRDEALERLGRP